MILFILQGIVVLIMHAVSGWRTPRGDFLIGFRLDPLHGGLHLVTGLIASYIGFGPPSEKAAVAFTQGFGIFYLLLAFFGTFTNIHFGLELGLSENSFHWMVGGFSALIGFGPALVTIIRGWASPEKRTL